MPLLIKLIKLIPKDFRHNSSLLCLVMSEFNILNVSIKKKYIIIIIIIKNNNNYLFF